MVVVRELTREILWNHVGTDNHIYSQAEAEFLSRYAPTQFAGKTFHETRDDPNALMEATNIVFDICIKQDLTIAYNEDLGWAAKEKTEIMNQILMAYGLESIRPSGNILKDMYLIKMQSLKFLELNTSHLSFPKKVLPNDPSLFPKEKEEMFALFGDVPMMIYGSSILESDPSDIDGMAFPERLEYGIYKSLLDYHDKKRKPPFTIVVIPMDYMDGFMKSDQAQRSCVVINRSLEIPDISKEHSIKLSLYNTAFMLVKARKNLIEKKCLDHCLLSQRRMGNRMKLPRFIHKQLSEACDKELTKPSIHHFKDVPSKAEYLGGLIEANLQIQDLLREANLYLNEHK